MPTKLWLPLVLIGALAVIALAWILLGGDETPAVTYQSAPRHEEKHRESPRLDAKQPVTALERAGIAQPETSTAPTQARILYGMIGDEQGRPVAGAQVVAAQWDRALAPPFDRRPALVTPGGAYALAGLEPGAWILDVTAPGYRSVEATITLTAELEQRRVDIRLQRRPRIAVFAGTDSGMPLQEARSELDEVDLGQLIAVATCQPPRTAVLTSQAPVCLSTWHSAEPAGPMPQPIGYLELLAPQPLHVSLLYRDAVIATASLAHEQDRVNFTVPVARLLATHASLTVHVATNESASQGVMPRIEIEANAERSRRVLAPDTQGDYVLPNVSLGPQMLRLLPEGHACIERLLDIVPGANHVEVSLAPAMTINGIVVDARARPVAATLTVIALDSPERRFAPIQLEPGTTLETSSDGTFRIEGCGAGRYLLRAHSRNPMTADASEAIVVDAHEPPSPTTLTLRSATPVALEYLGRAHAFVYAEILDERDLPIWQDRMLPGVTVMALAPGAYRLRIAAEIGSPRSVYPLRIGTTPAHLQLPAIEAGSCEIRQESSVAGADSSATDATGTIVYGAVHGPWPDGARPVLELSLAGSGPRIGGAITPPYYAVAGLQPGSYRIGVKGAGTTLEGACEIAAGARFVRVDLDAPKAR